MRRPCSELGGRKPGILRIVGYAVFIARDGTIVIERNNLVAQQSC